jgi:hypothetical protein
VTISCNPLLLPARCEPWILSPKELLKADGWDVIGRGLSAATRQKLTTNSVARATADGWDVIGRGLSAATRQKLTTSSVTRATAGGWEAIGRGLSAAGGATENCFTNFRTIQQLAHFLHGARLCTMDSAKLKGVHVDRIRTAIADHPP